MSERGYCPSCDVDIMPIRQHKGDGTLDGQRCPICQIHVPIEHRTPDPPGV